MGGASLSGIITENAISTNDKKVRYFLDLNVNFFKNYSTCFKEMKT